MDHDQILSKEDKHELFNERAGIREFDGGLSREEAERRAAEDVQRAKHRCEIRSILRLYGAEGIKGVDRFINLVAEKRGADAAARLQEEAIAQWQAGNRGKDGQWRELGLK